MKELGEDELALRRKIKLIQEGDYSEKNKKSLLDFAGYCRRARGNKPYTIIKNLIALKQLMDYGWINGKDFKRVTREDLEYAIDQMLMKGWTPQTQKSFKCALKVFWQFLYKIDGPGQYPKQVSWIRTTVKKDIQLRPEHIWTLKDFEKICRLANVFEKAVLWTAWSSAARPSEFINLKKSSLRFTKYGVDIFLFGRLDKPQRFVPCIECCEPLRAWLRRHPQKDEEDSYLWVTKYRGKLKKFTGSGINKLINRLAKRAKVNKKRNTIYTIRKSRLTKLSSDKNVPIHVLNSFSGWSPGSNISRHYVAISQRTMKSAILDSYGIDDEGEHELKYITCPFCKRKNAPSELICQDCDKPLIIRSAEDELLTEEKLDGILQDRITDMFSQLGLKVEKSDDGKVAQLFTKDGKVYMEMNTDKKVPTTN